MRWLELSRRRGRATGSQQEPGALNGLVGRPLKAAPALLHRQAENFLVTGPGPQLPGGEQGCDPLLQVRGLHR